MSDTRDAEPSLSAVRLAEKFEAISEHWSPRVVAALNGQHVKLARVLGAFDWHHHEDADELFLVVKGELQMHLRDGVVPIREGELYVVPRGVEHRPVAPEETWILMVEPAGTLNTGNVRNERTVESPEWI